MEDGQGVLADGTRYERQSGEERGANGFWYRWTSLRGVSQGGKVGPCRRCSGARPAGLPAPSGSIGRQRL